MAVRINRSFVKARLAQKDMTIGELADRVGVSTQTIHNLLNGAAFRTDTLGKLADALDATPSRLIDPREAEVA